MKKTMIATAVVATAGFATSASAGYFVIQSASVTGSSLTTPTGTYTSGNASTAFNLSLNGASAATAGAGGIAFTGTAGNAYSMTQSNANAVVTALGLTGNGTLGYFGFEASANGPGYFGVAFIGNGNTIDFTFGNAMNATLGVYSNYGATFAGNTWETAGAGVATVSGTNYVAIFAGLTSGNLLGAGTVSDTSFNVRYLDYNGASWATVASADGVSSSSLNVATYAVPVPAPALLAGAGLIGAAALRRRMAKKA
jgi:hypothetical protein